MHPNPSFRKETDERSIEFARRRAFGSLAVNADPAPLISHVPFLLNENASEIELHLVRSNPIVQMLKNGSIKAVIAATGGDAYISPDWYEVLDQVPTWNYIAVNIRGELELLPQEELHDVLQRQSAEMEKRLLPKSLWTSDKMDQQVYERMQRQIVPAKMTVEEIESTWKLSQNKPDEVRLRAADGVAKNGIGTETNFVSEQMRNAKSD